MANLLLLALAAGIGYVCGSIPPGYVYLRLFKGIDLRQVGSGRTGGTNSMRAGGVWIGVLTGVSDVMKGAAGIWLAQWLIAPRLSDAWVPLIALAVGPMVVIGHNWSIFLGFTGGAGTGPNVGWAMAYWWPIFPIAFALMPVTMVITGMASVASLCMGLIIPVVFGIRYVIGIDSSPVFLLTGMITFGIVAWALRPNIRRILNGTERLVGPRAKRRARQQQTKREQPA